MSGSIFQGDDEVPENPFAEFDTGEGVQVEAIEAVYQDVGEEPTPEYIEDSFDSEISEAERRFNKAALYKQWVSGRIFGDNDAPEVLEVEKEFKDFARSQLRKLIGIDQEPAIVDSVFTPEEATVLKNLAAQVLRNPRLAKPKEDPKPIIKKPPVLAPREAPVKPTAPVLAPRPIKPVPKPVQQAPKPVQQARPAPKPTQQAKPQVANRVAPKPTSAKPIQSKNSVPPNESVIKEGSKIYKIYHIAATPNEFGPASRQIVNSMGPNSTAKLINDIRVFKDASGSLFKIVKKDETPQAMPENRVPFPSDMQMDMATARMSERAAHVAINRDYGRR
jgi:hypothetical protein